MGDDQRELDYYVVSYVRDVVSGEKINIGLLALQLDGTTVSFAKSHFGRIELVQQFDPDADIEMLKSLCAEIESIFQTGQDVESFIAMALDSFSNQLQISDKQTIAMTEEPQREFERLAATYLRL